MASAPTLVPPPEPAAPVEEAMTIVLVKPCRWRSPGETTVNYAQRGDLISWPESRAKRAIELGAAVLPGTEIAKMHIAARGGRTYPDPALCVDLDTQDSFRRGLAARQSSMKNRSTSVPTKNGLLPFIVTKSGNCNVASMTRRTVRHDLPQGA
jgi:hypothetical protein